MWGQPPPAVQSSKARRHCRPNRKSSHAQRLTNPPNRLIYTVLDATGQHSGNPRLRFLPARRNRCIPARHVPHQPLVRRSRHHARTDRDTWLAPPARSNSPCWKSPRDSAKYPGSRRSNWLARESRLDLTHLDRSHSHLLRGSRAVVADALALPFPDSSFRSGQLQPVRPSPGARRTETLRRRSPAREPCRCPDQRPGPASAASGPRLCRLSSDAQLRFAGRRPGVGA